MLLANWLALVLLDFSFVAICTRPWSSEQPIWYRYLYSLEWSPLLYTSSSFSPVNFVPKRVSSLVITLSFTGLQFSFLLSSNHSSSIILCSFGTNSNLKFRSWSQTFPLTQEILQRGPCANHLQKSRGVACLAAVDRPFQPCSSFANYGSTRFTLVFCWAASAHSMVHACLLPFTMAQISYCMAVHATWQILALTTIQ